MCLCKIIFAYWHSFSEKIFSVISAFKLLYGFILIKNSTFLLVQQKAILLDKGKASVIEKQWWSNYFLNLCLSFHTIYYRETVVFDLRKIFLEPDFMFGKWINSDFAYFTPTTTIIVSIWWDWIEISGIQL